MIGRRVSHYQIVEQIGAGGMGTVYRALDTLLGRSVALKFPHPHLLRDPQARERFLREARAVSALDHPHVVVLFDVGEAEGEIFMAMQHVEGPSLRARLEKGPPPLRESLAMTRAVADALAHAHARGVIHRDLKPENILIGSEGRVKVADFGTARLLAETAVTQAGAVLGTGGYLAPEVIQGADADARADLFALGVILYELCSGRGPFQSDAPATALYKTMHQEPAPLPDAIPDDLRRLIGSLLEKNPERRPASAVVVANTLADLASPRSASTPEPHVPHSRSIAVLDFDNLTGASEDEYFCAGITEDLLTEIQKIPDLKVASRTAVAVHRGKSADPQRVGHQLGVATLLEGGVRRAGGRVRVTARLLRADNGYQMWAGRYDRGLEDIFEVQEDIASRIADALRLVLEPEDTEVARARRTSSPAAYDLRLRALNHFRRYEESDNRQAMELLGQALVEDPDYALAHANLAECFTQMVCKCWDADPDWLERGQAEARKARDLAPSLPEAYRALGHVYNHRRELHLGIREFHHSVELDPRFAMGLNGLAVNYTMLGELSRAEIYSRRAHSADPSGTMNVLTLADILFRQGRRAEARQALGGLASLRPGQSARLSRLELLLQLAFAEESRAEVETIEQELARDYTGPLAGALRALAMAWLGRGDEARALLAEGLASRLKHHYALVMAARAHARVGEIELALAALERAHQLDVTDPHQMHTDPLFDSLRGQPRFQAILAALPTPNLAQSPV